MTALDRRNARDEHKLLYLEGFLKTLLDAVSSCRCLQCLSERSVGTQMPSSHSFVFPADELFTAGIDFQRPYATLYKIWSLCTSHKSTSHAGWLCQRWLSTPVSAGVDRTQQAGLIVSLPYRVFESPLQLRMTIQISPGPIQGPRLLRTCEDEDSRRYDNALGVQGRDSPEALDNFQGAILPRTWPGPHSCARVLTHGCGSKTRAEKAGRNLSYLSGCPSIKGA